MGARVKNEFIITNRCQQMLYSKSCVKKTNYRLMQVKSIAECSHSAIHLTFIKLQVVIKTFVLSFLSGLFTHTVLILTSRSTKLKQLVHIHFKQIINGTLTYNVDPDGSISLWYAVFVIVQEYGNGMIIICVNK